MQKLKAKMRINSKEIEMNPFIEGYVANVTLAVVNSLKSVDYLKKLELHLDKSLVEILVNGEEVELTPFPQDIIASTMRGLVSVLKGAEESNSIDIMVDVGSLDV